MPLHPEDSEVEGEIKSITEFGIFIGLTEEIDGMVHLSDLDWGRFGRGSHRKFNKGDVVRAKILSIDIEKERVSLGIKQLSQDPFAEIDNFKKGDTVTCTVAQITTGGIEVSFEGRSPGLCPKDRPFAGWLGAKPERFAVGDKVDAIIMNVDRDSRRITLSVKALEISDEREAMAQYGSSDSGASLGDILGAAISRAREAEAAQAAPETDEKRRSRRGGRGDRGAGR